MANLDLDPSNYRPETKRFRPMSWRKEGYTFSQSKVKLNKEKKQKDHYLKKVYGYF